MKTLEPKYIVGSIFSPSLIIIYIGRLVSSLGDWIYMVVLSLIFAESAPQYIPLLWLSRSLATFFSGFIAGTISDRLGHKLTAIVSDIIRGITVLLMPFCIDTPVLLLLLVFLTSSLGTFFSASFNPIISKITENEPALRHRVNSIISMLTPLAQFIGPFIGTILMFKNDSLPFFAQSASFIISAITLFFISYPKKTLEITTNSRKKEKLNILWDDIKFSYRYIGNNTILKSITLSTTVFIFGSAAIDAYEVLFITKTLELGKNEYGLIISMGGIAYIISSICNFFVSRYLSSGSLIFFGFLITAIGNLIFAFSINFSTLLIGLLITAIGGTTYFVATSTITQNTVPIEIQGRITSFQQILPTAASTISTVLSGAFVNYISIRYIMIIGAVIIFLGVFPALKVLYSTQTSKQNKSKTANM
ncbi:MFS transporter [Bacillus cereus]|uniref:MFS transporter n=1 Tax=Bacillus cereus TaxID=1396 RepID=UPI003D07C7AC